MKKTKARVKLESRVEKMMDRHEEAKRLAAVVKKALQQEGAEAAMALAAMAFASGDIIGGIRGGNVMGCYKDYCALVEERVRTRRMH